MCRKCQLSVDINAETLCDVMMLVLQMKSWVKGYRLNPNKALDEIPVFELRGVTCHMGSHNVTCRLTQVNAPRLNPSQ